MTATEMPALSGREIMTALRCYSSNAREGGGCGKCPMDGRIGQLECSEMICRMAADEIGRLLDATEEICQRQMAQMIRWAGEANVSAERLLTGANQAQIDEILTCQRVLTELGRESLIRLQPMDDGGDRVLGIRVGETVIFGSMEEDGEADGAAG